MNAKSWKQPSPAGEGAQETPSLLTYLTTNDPAQRDAAFLQTYAARLRDGTAQSWEIPNTVASTIEDIAQRLVNHTLPPERAALVERLERTAGHCELSAEAGERGDWDGMADLLREAAAALRGETGDGQ